MDIRLRKDAEHLWKTLFISQEKGTLPWGDVVSSCLSGLSVSPKTRKTRKDEPTVFLMPPPSLTILDHLLTLYQ